MEAVKVINVKKRFGRLEVLKGINLSINRGEIVAILGPNASGKTTLLKIMVGLIKPSEGRVIINGIDAGNSIEFKKYTGYMPQEPKFPENITPEELVELICYVREEFPEKEIERLINLFGLKEHMKKKIRNLSGGTKQKLSALISLSFNPDILILDEPTAGLDPLSSRKLKEEIIKRKEEGKTIIITSHIISEVQNIADRIIFLMEGKIKIDSGMEEILKRFPSLEDALAHFMEEKI